MATQRKALKQPHFEQHVAMSTHAAFSNKVAAICAVAVGGLLPLRVSSHKLRATLAKHSVRFYGTGGTASLLQRIKWAVQLKARPPTFVLLLRGAAPVDESGQRFLSNMLRQTLKLQGVPLRLHLRWVGAKLYCRMFHQGFGVVQQG